MSDLSHLTEEERANWRHVCRMATPGVYDAAWSLVNALNDARADLGDLKDQQRCSACGCATPDEADGKECGCDAPVCLIEAPETLATMYERMCAEVEQLTKVRDALRAAGLETVRAVPAAQGTCRKEGFVFDGKGGRWETLAFTFYNRLVECAHRFEQLLGEEGEAALRGEQPEPAKGRVLDGTPLCRGGEGKP